MFLSIVIGVLLWSACLYSGMFLGGLLFVVFGKDWDDGLEIGATTGGIIYILGLIIYLI